MKKIIYIITLFIVLTGCSTIVSNENTQMKTLIKPEHTNNSTIQPEKTLSPNDLAINNEDETPNYPAKQVELYYPLKEGTKSTAKYRWDSHLFYESAVARIDNIVLVARSIGTKSSDILVYHIEEDAIYETFKMEPSYQMDSEYTYINRLLVDGKTKELRQVLRDMINRNLTEVNEKSRVIIKMPFTVGTTWSDGEIIDVSKDINLHQVQDYIRKGSPIPDKDTIVVKYKDHYTFYKKDIGIIHYIYTYLEYPN